MIGAHGGIHFPPCPCASVLDADNEALKDVDLEWFQINLEIKQ